MNISLYEAPAFAGLKRVADEFKTDFILTGAAAARLAIMATFDEARLESADVVDLCPFMDTLEVEVTDPNADLDLVRQAVEANVAWCDLTNLIVNRREGGDAGYRATLPLLRTEVGRDGFRDPDHVIDKAQDGVVRFSGAAGVPVQYAARALTLCADLFDFFGRCGLNSEARDILLRLRFGIPPSADGAATLRWLKASAGRFGASFRAFLDDEGLVDTLTDLGLVGGAAWLSESISETPRVLSPNLSQRHDGAQIALVPISGLPAGFSDHMSLVNAARRAHGGEGVGFAHNQDPIAPLPAFALRGGNPLGLIEISVPVDDEIGRGARGVALDGILFVMAAGDVSDIALATPPMAIAGGVSDGSRRAIMRLSAEPLAAAADIAPLVFRPFMVKHNPDAQSTPPPTKRQKLHFEEVDRLQESREQHEQYEQEQQPLVHKAGS